MLVSLDVVQQERGAKTAWKLRHRRVQGDAIHSSRKQWVVLRVLPPARHFLRALDFIQTHWLSALLPEVHQHLVYRQAIEPGGERGLPAEVGDFPEYQ